MRVLFKILIGPKDVDMIPYAKDVEETAEMLVVEVFVYHMARTF